MKYTEKHKEFADKLTVLCQDSLDEGLLLADFIREMEVNKLMFALKFGGE